MNACDAAGGLAPDSFGALRNEMSTDLYWVRFFARPCCPAPDAQGAAKMLDRLSAEVEARADLSPSERQELKEIIEDRKNWYPTSGLCKG